MATYDAVTLRRDGDQLEQKASIIFNLDAAFPNYEEFWKLHVVPGTQRPYDPKRFNLDISPAVIELAQRSYSVFANLYDASVLLESMRAGEFGEFHRNWYALVKCAGDALQLRLGMCETIEGPIAMRVGMALKVFPEWKSVWKPSYDAVSVFRNYSTHQGRFQIFVGAGQPFIISRSELTTDRVDSVSWTYTECDFRDNPEMFQPIIEVANGIMEDTIKWLDKAYGEFLRVLNPLLLQPAYRVLWGLQRTAALPGSSSGTPTAPHWQSGVNYVPPMNICATTSPPNSKSTK